MRESNKQRDIEIAIRKRHVRELWRAIWCSRQKNWQPAPEDTGIKPGGIRDRAVKLLTGSRKGGA